MKCSHFVAFFRHLLYSFSELQIHPDEITFNSVLGACLQGILRSKNRGECQFSRLSCAITENAHASEVLQASVYALCSIANLKISLAGPATASDQATLQTKSVREETQKEENH